MEKKAEGSVVGNSFYPGGGGAANLLTIFQTTFPKKRRSWCEFGRTPSPLGSERGMVKVLPTSFCSGVFFWLPKKPDPHS